MSSTEGVVKFIRGAAGSCADDVADAELVRRFASASDEQAFRVLVARYGPAVWAVCRRLSRSHHDAEDAFQATFLVFTRKAGELHADAAVGSWLYGVAYKVASRLRGARRIEATGVEPADALPGALDELTVREAEVALHEELARLPERYRAALVLCCLDGLSRDEAAARLGWTANRVKHALERGRGLLRSRLARRGVALGLPLATSLLATPARAVPPPVAEAAVRHANGSTPPAAISSLAHGVNRTMWLSKWKWAAAGCAALVLTAGGTLAAVLRDAPEAPTVPVVKAEPVFAPPAPEPKAQPRPKKDAPPWEVAAEYLRLAVEGKTEQALKLAEPRMIDEKEVKEIQVSGLKRVKIVMILLNDERALVVTERAQLVRGGGPRPEDAHAVVTLEKKPDVPWVVRGSDLRDSGGVWREAEDYLDGKFNRKPDAKEEKEAKAPKAEWDVATEFLKLAIEEKTADALKLVVPGTVSENKVGEIKKSGVKGHRVVGVLLNDTRIEAISEQQKLSPKENETIDGHIVIMLAKSKDGAWQVKDIDLRDRKELEPRVELYFGGRYDEKPK